MLRLSGTRMGLFRQSISHTEAYLGMQKRVALHRTAPLFFRKKLKSYLITVDEPDWTEAQGDPAYDQGQS
jgi:hypothetical protein